MARAGVALRKESVDRNDPVTDKAWALEDGVALRKESVDRNCRAPQKKQCLPSLSARRAWIEIFIRREMSLIRPVALRKESVDRNIPRGQLPATQPVALRKESVDRNWISCMLVPILLGRSPQGERG